MSPRPFRILPRVSRNAQGWSYLRWGRTLRRLDPLPGTLGRWRGLVQDCAAMACILAAFGTLTLLGVAAVAP